jgi:hypothetical protein
VESSCIDRPGRYELTFDSISDTIFAYLMAPGTHPGHPRWIDIDLQHVPCFLDGTSMTNVRINWSNQVAAQQPAAATGPQSSPTGYPYQLPPPTVNIPAGYKISLGGWGLTDDEPPKAPTCTCGEAATGKSKNHWADCALVTSK